MPHGTAPRAGGRKATVPREVNSLGFDLSGDPDQLAFGLPMADDKARAALA